jgi:gas vesicle protein
VSAEERQSRGLRQRVAPLAGLLTQRRPARVGAAARAVAGRAPQTLTVVRSRAQPAAVTIARLASTAVFAYLIALLVPGSSSRPVLAPLTALLVAEATLYQTLHNAVRRVGAVVAGVLVAVGLAAGLGFTWWSLGITIVAALVVGFALRLSDHLLEVPISAMLILSVGIDPKAAAASRVEETLIGAVAGLVAGVLLAPPRVQPAEEAVDDLCRQLADLLYRMADGLTEPGSREASGQWLDQARELRGDIRRVDGALAQAEESVRLSPRVLQLPGIVVALRNALEVVEHAALTALGLARSIADSSRLDDADRPLRESEIRAGLAETLRELAAAVRTYGRLVSSQDPGGREWLRSELDRHLTAAQDAQDRLSELLGTDPVRRPVGWPLRGELISHLDRLRTELQQGSAVSAPQRRRLRPWRRPGQPALGQGVTNRRAHGQRPLRRGMAHLEHHGPGLAGAVPRGEPEFVGASRPVVPRHGPQRPGRRSHVQVHPVLGQGPQRGPGRPPQRPVADRRA